uniref:Uncharacterized protein n=1 Tax=Caenorhabditis japonica TaxID=281687 RepID=A0A8R1E577_CAEJA
MEYENCTNDWNVCFQEIRVVPVTLDGKYAFLYASGCAENSSLTAAELSEAQFMEMCTKQGLARCRHQYSHGHYKGTFCCEQNDVDVLKSWLFGIFFGDSEEMMYELEATVQYVEKENTGKRRVCFLKLNKASLPFFRISRVQIHLLQALFRSWP